MRKHIGLFVLQLQSYSETLVMIAILVNHKNRNNCLIECRINSDNDNNNSNRNNNSNNSSHSTTKQQQ